jgi:hypothetical protein
MSYIFVGCVTSAVSTESLNNLLIGYEVIEIFATSPVTSRRTGKVHNITVSYDQLHRKGNGRSPNKSSLHDTLYLKDFYWT